MSEIHLVQSIFLCSFQHLSKIFDECINTLYTVILATLQSSGLREQYRTDIHRRLITSRMEWHCIWNRFHDDYSATVPTKDGCRPTSSSRLVQSVPPWYYGASTCARPAAFLQFSSLVRSYITKETGHWWPPQRDRVNGTSSFLVPFSFPDKRSQFSLIVG